MYYLLILVIHGGAGGALLMACCSLLNWFERGRSSQPELQPVFSDKDKSSIEPQNVDPENANPYAAPADYTVTAKPALRPSAVPVPTFFHAFWIVTIWLFFYGISFALVATVAEQALPVTSVLFRIAESVFALLLGFVILAGIVSARLPAKFPKACLVALMYTLTGVIVLFLGGCVIGFIMAWIRAPGSV